MMYSMGIAQNYNLYWDKTYGGNSRDWNNIAVVDSSGNIFLIGDSQTNVDGDKSTPLCPLQPDHSDIWLLKLDPDGNILWQKNYGSDSDERNPKLIFIRFTSIEFL